MMKKTLTSWVQVCGLHLSVVLLSLSSHLSAEAAAPPDFRQTPTMAEEVQTLVQYLEGVHYEGKPISRLDMKAYMEAFMSDLDAQRLFFLQEDKGQFEERYAGYLDVLLKQGKLMPAFEIFKVYRKRALERIDWVFKRLDGDFNFSDGGNYAPDRSEAEWPETEAEANALWEHRIEYEMMAEMLGLIERKQDEEKDVPSAEKSDEKAKEKEHLDIETVLSKLDEAKTIILKRYKQQRRNIEQLDVTEVQEIFLTSLTHMYDPHSTFLSADSLEDFAIAMKNSLVGIGAMLSTEDGYCTIKELVPGGPADTSDLLGPEDKILAVAQDVGEFEDVVGMKLRKIVKLIRGKKGTKVRLLIQPGEGAPSERKEITLVRDKIKLTAALAQAEIFQVPHDSKTYSIGVIELPSFYGGDRQGSSTSGDVEELIHKLKQASVEGIVLDLRHNGGGLLSEAVNLAGLFIPSGPVVQVKNTIGNIDEHTDRNQKVAWGGPLIVLVSRFSASASEIVTGALKNHSRALVVGDSATHGKGTVQAVFEMDRTLGGSFFRAFKPRRGAAKVTIQKWYLPNGESTQIRGVASDISLPSPREFLPIGENDLPGALEWDSISPLPSFEAYAFKENGELGDNLIYTNLIDELRGYSLKRQEKLEEFNYQKDRIKWLEARSDKKDFSLNLEEWISRRNEEREFRDEMKQWLEKLAEKNYPSEEILLDITLKKQNESRVAHGNTEEEEEEEGKPDLDIHLRESLRIMVDWLSQKTKQPRAEIASQRHS